MVWPEWDESFNQNSRLNNYLIAKEKLLQSGRLYPCYETPEELAIKGNFSYLVGCPYI